MTAQTILKPISFEEFVTWYPQDGRYELIDGIVTEMQPTGDHEDVTEFIATAFTLETNRLQLPYKLPRRALIKASSWDTGYLPDVLVVDRESLRNEPLWQDKATITKGSSIKLVVEVVSTNWETDYARKAEDYEAMGISEYWIVDYAALGGKRFIGSPKQPTVSVCTQIDGEFRIDQYRGSDRIVSSTFPDLQMTAEQVLRAGR